MIIFTIKDLVQILVTYLCLPPTRQRAIFADNPNQKWLTDISEFAIASGKLYLSIIRDCYNDEIISWKIAEEHLPDLPMQLLKMLFKSKQQVHYNPFRQRMSLQIAWMDQNYRKKRANQIYVQQRQLSW